MSLADIAAKFAPKGGGGDFVNFEDGSVSRIRLYRVCKDGQKNLLAFTENVIWTGTAYIEPNEDTEKARQTLLASGTKEDKAKAKTLQARLRAWVMIVLPDDPQGFRIWKIGSSLVQRLMSIAATKAEGGMKVPFADTKEFYEKAEKGLDILCGPQGWDLCLSVNKKLGPAAMYDLSTLDKPPQGFKVLPFTEEETPDPSETARRIANSRKDKASK